MGGIVYYLDIKNNLLEMVDEGKYRNVINATVTMVKKGGQGVLINGNLIITAAHCIDFSYKGDLTTEQYLNEEIKTNQGNIKVIPLAVDLINDLAVLGGFDDHLESIQFEKFNRFCDHNKALIIYRKNFELFKYFRIHIFTHDRKWITGYAMQCKKYSTSLTIKVNEEIKPETCGSPVINDFGEIVGIITNSTIKDSDNNNCISLIPRPHLALPVWVYQQIIYEHKTKVK